MAEVQTTQPTVFDTDRQYLGDVYAKAMLSVGQEAGNMDQVLEELDSFTDAMSKLDSIRLALESPRVATPEKLAVVDKVTTAAKCSEEFKRFLKVLVEKGRFDCLFAVRQSAQKMYQEMAGKVEARVTTADEIDDGLRNKIAEKLSTFLGKDVLVRTDVDPNIIGGMVVRVGDTVFDSSIANELNRVRHGAVQRAGQEIRKSLDRFASE